MSRDDLVPEVRAFQDANTDQERAGILRSVSDATLLKFWPVFDAACERVGFTVGRRFIAARLATLRSPRDRRGNLPEGVVDEAVDAALQMADLPAQAAS